MTLTVSRIATETLVLMECKMIITVQSMEMTMNRRGIYAIFRFGRDRNWPSHRSNLF